MHILKRVLLAFLAKTVVPVLFTSPACGATLTNAAVTVLWNSSPGTQFSYRLRVYSDAAMTVVVYDSGIVVTSVQSANIPFGVLQTARTYYPKVDIVNTDGSTGVSGACSWTTSFATSVAVTGVRVDAFGACGGDPRELPGVRVRWTRVTPGGSETFVEYDVLRRIAGEANYTRIGIVSAVATVEFDDYTVMPGTAYQYAVTWTAYSGGSTLVSAPQAVAPAIRPLWDSLFVHDVSNVAYFVRLDTWQVTEVIGQDVEFMQLAGRQGATAQIGERQGKHWRIPAQERPLNERMGSVWEDLVTLITRQRTAGSTLLARYGAINSGMFCNGSVERSVDRRSYTPSADLTETNYEISV